jgi:adenylylsulfate kinase-like enzyme
MNINQNFNVLWLTGMSGSGKSTLASYLAEFLTNRGYKTRIIDGDDVRGKDEKKLGFGYEDVLKNNLRIAELCLDLKNENLDIVIVPVISPYKDVRKKVKVLLNPFLHLIYIKSNISSLKDRDTKGLYAASDRGEIVDLIGYSDINPYDEPKDPSVVINTCNNTTLGESKNKLLEYIKDYVIINM